MSVAAKISGSKAGSTFKTVSGEAARAERSRPELEDARSAAVHAAKKFVLMVLG